MVDIILGLLYPDKGKILANGHDVAENFRGWQDEIGYVPQTIYLTDDSLRRNVAFGIADHEIDGEAVKMSFKAAHLDDFIGILKEGLDTFVGERGVSYPVVSVRVPFLQEPFTMIHLFWYSMKLQALLIQIRRLALWQQLTLCMAIKH